VLTGTLRIIVLVALAWSGSAHAVLTIRITQGVEGALPIAVVPFAWQGATRIPPEQMDRVIASDLRRTGRFNPLPRADMPGTPHEGTDIDFRDWRRLGVENIVVGRLRARADGGYVVEFQLFDVFKGLQLAGYSIPTPAADLRRTAHQISDIVYERLTGEPGAFATYIAYVVEERTPAGERRYTLAVADSDGHDPQVVLESAEPVLSPAWSPDGERLAYVSFEGGNSEVYVQDLQSGRREKVAAFEGINSAPAWSPDGERLALTLSRDGNPEIYVLDLRTRVLRRLTDNAAIDTEANWAPDGESLVFTSDRGGRPQIYRVDADGGRPQRVTFEGNYNARARFTPDGERLVVVHGRRGSYHIAVLDLETGALRILSDALLDESPSVAPNGSMIIYATQDAEGSALAAVSIDGRVRQRLSSQAGLLREPAWSPFIQ
jgi:TolB protein